MPTDCLRRLQVLGKAEFLNPGGSVKDRVALRIVQEALAAGQLAAPGGLITEGTAGSTGVSLAMVRGSLSLSLSLRGTIVWQALPPVAHALQSVIQHVLCNAERGTQVACALGCRLWRAAASASCVRPL